MKTLMQTIGQLVQLCIAKSCPCHFVYHPWIIYSLLFTLGFLEPLCDTLDDYQEVSRRHFQIRKDSTRCPDLHSATVNGDVSDWLSMSRIVGINDFFTPMEFTGVFSWRHAELTPFQYKVETFGIFLRYHAFFFSWGTRESSGFIVERLELNWEWLQVQVWVRLRHDAIHHISERETHTHKHIHTYVRAHLIR